VGTACAKCRFAGCAASKQLKVLIAARRFVLNPTPASPTPPHQPRLSPPGAPRCGEANDVYAARGGDVELMNGGQISRVPVSQKLGRQKGPKIVHSRSRPSVVLPGGC
jgi:hypothetical protein